MSDITTSDARSAAGPWVTSWSQASADISVTGAVLDDTTLRFQITLSLGGDALRVRFTNRFGREAVEIGAAVILSGDERHELRFDGASAARIPAAGELLSDPVRTPLREGERIDLHVFLPGRFELSTGSFGQATWQPSEPADHTRSADFPALDTPRMPLPDGSEIDLPVPLLRSLEVSGARADRVVVCLGDSITAAGWPERAARRLAGTGTAIANRGIAGNRLLHDGAGPFGPAFGTAAQDRFDADVLATVGGTHLIIAIGTNDIGQPGSVAPADELPTPEQLIDGLDRLAARAEAAGLTVLLATITPFMPASGYDDARDAMREQVNAWIRAQAPRRATVDFDAALRSSTDPARLRDVDDSGDHLHPSDQGLDHMADTAADVLRSTTQQGARR